MTDESKLHPLQSPGSNDSDLATVSQVLGGSQRAFEGIVRRHERRVYRTTLAVTGNSEDAEEAMQDTFLKAYFHLSEFRGQSRFTTWLTRIAVNEGLLILRRRRDSVSLDDPEAPGELQLPRRFQEWYADPERRFASQEMRELVEEAVKSLPPEYRVVFVLRDIEELTTEEAAEVLDLKIPALKSRLLRARMMVRERLAVRIEKPHTLKSRMMQAAMRVRDAMHSPRLRSLFRAKAQP